MDYTSETMLVRSHRAGREAVFASLTAEQAGWEFLNMAARCLRKGERWSHSSGNCEFVHVVLGGACHVRTSQGNFEYIGSRANVFDGLPCAVYLSRNIDFEIQSASDMVEIASCWVPTDRDHPVRLIKPEDCAIELRGGGNFSRQIVSVLPPGFDCHRLICVEVYTPGGNWSSYPPHKHDVHREDVQGNLLEADLEEIYFYKIDKPEGYAYQRVYNEDRSIDGLMMPRTNDLVIVPEGYHPVVTPPGYNAYYLNFLAGSAQSLANTDDPAYAWVKGESTELDPRLPLVDP